MSLDPQRPAKAGIFREAMQARIRRLKTLPVLPTLLTAGNLACGVTAILCAAHGRLELGAILIFAAMVCDLLDGKVARLTKTSGPFGAELDSLSDLVSFGVAPAVLVHRLVLGEPGVFDPGQRILWFITVFAPVMAAIRLARYNVESHEGPTSHFRGLPSPGFAAVICAWIIIHEEFTSQLADWGLVTTGHYTGLINLDPFRFGALGVLFTGSLLMVSNLPYPHVGNTMLGRISFTSFIVLLLLIVLLVSYPAITLLVVTTGYLLSGLGLAALRARQNWARGRDTLADDADDDAEDAGSSAVPVLPDDGPALGR